MFLSFSLSGFGERLGKEGALGGRAVIYFFILTRSGFPHTWLIQAIHALPASRVLPLAVLSELDVALADTGPIKAGHNGGGPTSTKPKLVIDTVPYVIPVIYIIQGHSINISESIESCLDPLYTLRTRCAVWKYRRIRIPREKKPPQTHTKKKKKKKRAARRTDSMRNVTEARDQLI